MSESSLWNYLYGLLPPRGIYTRIESHETAPGFPDVHYRLEKVEGTIELKDAKPDRIKARYPFAIGGLLPTQITWLGEYRYSGGRPLVGARVGKDIWFFEAGHALALNTIPQEQYSILATCVLHPRQRARSREKLRDLLVNKLTFATRGVID